MAETTPYAAGLQIDYPDGPRDRLTVFFRLIWALPVLILYGLLNGGSATHSINQAGKAVETSGGGIALGLFVATALMLVVRQRYPRWWFDFAVELARFGARVGSYLLLLTDLYPSTVETQAVHLEVAYPHVAGLNRWLPLVKWLLAIPHYVVLVLLGIAVVVVTIIAWIAILVTGSYPRSLFDFVVGVGRWAPASGLTRSCWLPTTIRRSAYSSDADQVLMISVRHQFGPAFTSRPRSSILSSAWWV